MSVSVLFFFLLVSGIGCGLWLWLSIDYSINFLYTCFYTYTYVKPKTNKISELLVFSCYLIIKWVASWQNQQNGMCAKRRLRSAWASAQSDQSLHCPHEKSLSPQLPLGAQRRLWSDWAEAQADLSLRWVHMPFCWFCLKAAQMLIINYMPLGSSISICFIPFDIYICRKIKNVCHMLMFSIKLIIIKTKWRYSRMPWSNITVCQMIQQTNKNETSNTIQATTVVTLLLKNSGRRQFY